MSDCLHPGGDLSGDRLAPTVLNLALAANDLTMTSGMGSGSAVREHCTLVLPQGRQLDSIVLLSANIDCAASFIGVRAGSTFTERATGTNVANLLGWHHFAESDAGTDILDHIATGLGAQGFVPPLGNGYYTFWAQDFGFQADYSMRFSISPVPEPGLGSLVGVGLLGLGACSRRRHLAVKTTAGRT